MEKNQLERTVTFYIGPVFVARPQIALDGVTGACCCYTYCTSYNVQPTPSFHQMCHVHLHAHILRKMWCDYRQITDPNYHKPTPRGSVLLSGSAGGGTVACFVAAGRGGTLSLEDPNSGTGDAARWEFPRVGDGRMAGSGDKGLNSSCIGVAL